MEGLDYDVTHINIHIDVTYERVFIHAMQIEAANLVNINQSQGTFK